MKKLGERNYTILLMGIRDSGSYNPMELFPYIEEMLYVHESETIKEFLQWCVDGGTEEGKFGTRNLIRGFGHSNYEERFQEFLKTK